MVEKEDAERYSRDIRGRRQDYQGCIPLAIRIGVEIPENPSAHKRTTRGDATYLSRFSEFEMLPKAKLVAMARCGRGLSEHGRVCGFVDV
jgi:hypothetical protein